MPKPNVLFILTDQQRWDTTGVHANPLGLTPQFDRLAQTGTHFAYAFTPQPVCGPARAVLQTGRYATNTGCYRNGIPLPEEQFTLARAFRAAGYRTGYIGKWHLGPADAVGPVPAALRGGYQDWLAANLLEFTSDAYRTTLYDEAGGPVRLPGYRVDALTDAAIRYIDRWQAQPFFLFLSYLEPHFQNTRDDYPAPDGYAEQYQGRWLPPDLAGLPGSAHQHSAGYFGMVKRLDEALGRLLDALKSLGLLEDTLVVFTSDHGNHFKTRNSEYKRSCHESSLRIPLAIDGPGFHGGGRIEQLTSLVDLPPTLLDAAGLPVPAFMEGRSLLPLVRRQGLDGPDEVFVQISESQVGRALRTPRWKYSVRMPTGDPAAGNTRPAAAVYAEDCLYDLLADPYEFRNLVQHAAYVQVRADLRARLLEWIAKVEGAAPQIVEAEITEPVGQRTLEPLTFLPARKV
jgi:arylsulfatase A-like enzyme